MIKIFAYGPPDYDEEKNFVIDSLNNERVSRFFYSYIDNCDLNRLATLQPDKMTADEKEIFRRGKRLLTLKAGDYILHKHIPERGKVTAVRICSDYFYDANPKPIDTSGRQDGRHCFRVDKIFEFSRDAVHPQLQTKLKVMGALYKIPDVKEFFESMQALGMPLDQADYIAAAEAGAILTNSTNPLPQQVNSPLKKVSAIRENYLKELLKVLCNMSPDDPSRNEVLDNIFETLRMFSFDTLKNMIKGMFIKSGYRLIDDESDLVFEMFPERELMHDFYNSAVELKKIFVHVNSSPKLDAADGNIHIVIDLTGTLEKSDEIIFIDGETFAEILARHGTR